MVEERKELTDSEYWNETWKTMPLKPLSPGNMRFGKRGFFQLAFTSSGLEFAGKSMLEIGGGRSYILLGFTKWHGVLATALDYSPVGLDQTETLFAMHGEKCQVLLKDFLKDQIDDQFDFVTHYGVIEHFTDPGFTLEKAAKLVRPGGYMLFSMPNMQCHGAKWWAKYSPKNWSTHIYHSDQKILEACQGAGLELVESFGFGVPSFRSCRWEKQGVLPVLLTGAQVFANGFGKLFPIFARWSPKWSSHRGFIARKK